MEINITPVGIMHCEIKQSSAAPKNYTESVETGRIEIYPEYLEALDGIESGQTLIVLFWLHEAKRDLLRVYPRGDKSRGLRGVFATRSPVRPNPIALSELKVMKVENNMIEVSGVDVIDDTPVLDIKSVVMPDKDKKTT